MPDLILLDVVMPKMDGYQVCKLLKADKKTRNIPVIFVSASATVESEALGLVMGAVDYITKPVNQDILMFRIKTHLELKRQRDIITKSKSYLDSIMASMADSLFVISTSGIIRTINQQGCKMLGLPEGMIIDQPFNDFLVSKKLPQNISKIEEMIKTDFNGNIESTMIGKDGCNIPVLISGSVMHETNKDISGLVLIAKEISDFKITQQLLHERQTQLRAAELANQTKSNFLANMSHEIRTPMNAIVGLADLASKVNVSPKIQDYLAKIIRASHSLLYIINDILDLSKIEAGKLEFFESEFLLREVYTNIIEMFRPKIAQKNIELIMGVIKNSHFVLYGDPNRLSQIIKNLLDNAIKFTNSGQVIFRAETKIASSDHVTIEFSIKDTGIGMTDEQINKLFLPFSQVDISSTRKFGGTGLGLSISKKLVEMMGGKVWVESKLGIGSTFYFSLNFKRIQGSETGQIIAPKEMQHLRTLIIDENPYTILSLEEIINTFGFEVTGVRSQERAIKAIKQGIEQGRPYQLMLVDWLTSDMDEIIAFAGQKNNKDQQVVSPKVLLMSPFEQDKILRPGKDRIGVDGYVSKPINCSLLFDSIMQAFGKDIAKISTPKNNEIDLLTVVNVVGGANVLLVEDNAINRQVAKEYLEGIGLVVDMAEDGLRALKMVHENKYDIVFMDIQMPNMDGFQATSQIRSSPQHRDLPILAMTAHAMIGDKKRCLDAGMNDHVAKPINNQRLLEALLKWIKPREGLGLSSLPEQKKFTNDGQILVELPGIDVKEALGRLNGNYSILRSVLYDFLSENALTEKTVHSLLSRGTAKDIKAADKLIHTIAGLAGNMSAKKLFETAIILQKKIHKPKNEWLSELDDFGDALNQIIESIDALQMYDKTEPVAHVANEGDTCSPQFDKEKTMAIINTLSQRLHKKDFEALEIIDSLIPILRGAKLEKEDEISSLELDVYGLDFESALNSLEVIADAVKVL